MDVQMDGRTHPKCRKTFKKLEMFILDDILAANAKFDIECITCLS